VDLTRIGRKIRKKETERVGNPAGPYENLASNRVLNLIKTQNPPRARPAGTCRGCEQEHEEFKGSGEQEKDEGEEEEEEVGKGGRAREPLTAGMPP